MTTSRYPHIEKLGMMVHKGIGPNADYVVAESLENIFAKAPRVWGYYHERAEDDKRICSLQDDGQSCVDTHTALLIAIEPIEKAVSEDELSKLLTRATYIEDGMVPHNEFLAFQDLLKRIYEHGYRGNR